VSRAFQPCRCGDSRGWAGVPGTSCGMSAGCVIAFAANTGKCLARSPSAVGVVGVCQSLAGHERADDAVRPRGSDTGPGGSRMAEIRWMLGPDATRTRKPRRLHRRAIGALRDVVIDPTRSRVTHLAVEPSTLTPRPCGGTSSSGAAPAMTMRSLDCLDGDLYRAASVVGWLLGPLRGLSARVACGCSRRRSVQSFLGGSPISVHPPACRRRSCTG
jgi:hypothetical protein